MDPRRPHVHGCFSMCMCMRSQVHMCVFLGVPSVYACAVSHLWVSSVYMCVCTSIRVSSQGAVCMPECQTSLGVVCPVCLHEHICVHVCVQVCGVAVERLRVHSSGRQRVFFCYLYLHLLLLVSGVCGSVCGCRCGTAVHAWGHAPCIILHLYVLQRAHWPIFFLCEAQCVCLDQRPCMSVVCVGACLQVLPYVFARDGVYSEFVRYERVCHVFLVFARASGDKRVCACG